MSQKSVQEIIGKAVTDKEFRDSWTKDLEAVFRAYPDLTEEEKTGLRKMKMESVDTFAGDLDDRISKGRVGNI